MSERNQLSTSAGTLHFSVTPSLDVSERIIRHWVQLWSPHNACSGCPEYKANLITTFGNRWNAMFKAHTYFPPEAAAPAPAAPAAASPMAMQGMAMPGMPNMQQLGVANSCLLRDCAKWLQDCNIELKRQITTYLSSLGNFRLQVEHLLCDSQLFKRGLAPSMFFTHRRISQSSLPRPSCGLNLGKCQIFSRCSKWCGQP